MTLHLVDQTITVETGGEARATGDEETTGNCFTACIATVIQCEIETIPNFCAYEDWWKRAIEWLDQRGWSCTFITPDVLGHLRIGDMPLCIATGKSPRGDWNHSVVWEGSGMVHDPHTSRAGLEGPVLEYTLIWEREP